MLENFLSVVPDTLTVDEVAELTGYHRRTVLRYVQRKYIYGVNMMGKYYISKQSGMRLLLMTIKLCLNMNSTLVFGVVLIMQHTFNEV